jgi:hypothetical protein
MNKYLKYKYKYIYLNQLGFGNYEALDEKNKDEKQYPIREYEEVPIQNYIKFIRFCKSIRDSIDIPIEFRIKTIDKITTLSKDMDLNDIINQFVPVMYIMLITQFPMLLINSYLLIDFIGTPYSLKIDGEQIIIDNTRSMYSIIVNTDGPNNLPTTFPDDFPEELLGDIHSRGQLNFYSYNDEDVVKLKKNIIKYYCLLKKIFTM